MFLKRQDFTVLKIMKIIHALGLVLGLFWYGVSVQNALASGNDPSLEKPFVTQFSSFYRYDDPRGMMPLHFVGTDGQSRTVADYKGKVVLLHFWATWCPPCIKELPRLNELQAAMKAKEGGEGLVILPISLDYNANHEQILKFMKKNGAADLPSLIVPPGDGGWDSLTSFALPTTFVIGRDGAVLYKLIGDGHWTSPTSLAFLDNLLKNQKK